MCYWLRDDGESSEAPGWVFLYHLRLKTLPSTWEAARQGSPMGNAKPFFTCLVKRKGVGRCGTCSSLRSPSDGSKLRQEKRCSGGRDRPDWLAEGFYPRWSVTSDVCASFSPSGTLLQLIIILTCSAKAPFNPSSLSKPFHLRDELSCRDLPRLPVPPPGLAERQVQGSLLFIYPTITNFSLSVFHWGSPLLPTGKADGSARVALKGAENKTWWSIHCVNGLSVAMGSPLRQIHLFPYALLVTAQLVAQKHHFTQLLWGYNRINSDLPVLFWWIPSANVSWKLLLDEETL